MNEGRIPWFVADGAFHTCAALGGRGESQRPGPLVTFGTESNITAIYGCYYEKYNNSYFAQSDGTKIPRRFAHSEWHGRLIVAPTRLQQKI